MEKTAVCLLCPRKCGVDRKSSLGVCKAPWLPKVARAGLHFWEEPSISGTKGSGTIFFTGCNLKCVYCQNYKISQEGFGKEISTRQLSEIFLELQSLGAHNINLISPTPYIPQIIEAIKLVRDKMNIPFVYNTGGYESIESLNLLDGYIDIFLTDIKYKSPELSAKYSGAGDYFEVSVNAAKKMIDMVKEPCFDQDGIMKSGVIIRHLVLPGCRQDSVEILKEISSRLPKKQFLLSLMSQYTPNGHTKDGFDELSRRVTTFEYDKVVDAAINLGLVDGYIQEKSSANQKYTPPFDLSGV